MSAALQEWIALGIVAAAALALLFRHYRRRRQPGCPSACACPSRKLSR